MIGITSYGGYIPKLRLDRMSIVKHMDWFAPSIAAMAQGERSFCNWDEDSLTMAVSAAKDCLNGMDKSLVDGLYLCSTTLPFSDRLNAGILKTALNLKDELQAADLTSTLRAGTTGMIEALSFIRSGDRRSMLVTASDRRLTKTAQSYEMWFGDGAASFLVGREGVIAEFMGSHSVTHDFVDHYRGAGKKYDYIWEDRWIRDEGYSQIIPQAVNGLLRKLEMSMDDVERLVFPCYFKAEHRKIAKKLGAEPEKVLDNLHEICGETGAAHPLVMLVLALQEAAPGDRVLVAGFGQGCDALCFRVTDAVRALPPRGGIRGAFKNKKSITNYPKFLAFRGLLQSEMGIRGESPTQTAMTVLWRKRDMILGLVGGRCRECGTPQFPRMDICVKPSCRAFHTQEPYEFSDVPARINSFTGDHLTVDLDPPGIYGMIQFEGGGRFMADFTDCDLDELEVGQPVKMSFRKRYDDEGRGFTGYFWKAVPVARQRSGKKDSSVKQIRFDGKVAVVTGAGGGLGRSYALELAKRGARVVVNDHGGTRDGSGEGSQSPADEVVAEIKSMGGEAVASYDSVSTPEGGAAMVETALRAFGRVDILINNAGILRDKTLVKMEQQDWGAVLDVHLNGAYNVTRPALVEMRKAGYGRIVFTTSAAGLYGNFGQANYSAAKMGLVGLMNTLKLEGAKYDIKSNTVAPLAATRLTRDILPSEQFEDLKPEFVTPVVIYLSSEECGYNGAIFNAGMGHFSRVAIVAGAGVTLGGKSAPPTAESISAHISNISDLSDGREFENAKTVTKMMKEAFEKKMRSEK